MFHRPTFHVSPTDVSCFIDWHFMFRRTAVSRFTNRRFTFRRPTFHVCAAPLCFSDADRRLPPGDRRGAEGTRHHVHDRLRQLPGVPVRRQGRGVPPAGAPVRRRSAARLRHPRHDHSSPARRRLPVRDRQRHRVAHPVRLVAVADAGVAGRQHQRRQPRRHRARPRREPHRQPDDRTRLVHCAELHQRLDALRDQGAGQRDDALHRVQWSGTQDGRARRAGRPARRGAVDHVHRTGGKSRLTQVQGTVKYGGAGSDGNHSVKSN